MRKILYYIRIQISKGLTDGKSFKEIAWEICKDRTTVAKEIKRNAIEVPAKRWHNNCVYRFTCTRTALCTDCSYVAVAKQCAKCNHCNGLCRIFKGNSA